MHQNAMLVRQILRWAQHIVLLEESRGVSVPRPALPKCILGKYMERTDKKTAIAIAMDCDGYREKNLLEAVAEITRVEPKPVHPFSLRRMEGYDLALRVISRERALFDKDSRRLLEQGSVVKTWKALEDFWPGRNWASLRDDFERHALDFWKVENIFLYGVNEFIVKTGYDESSVKKLSKRHGRSSYSPSSHRPWNSSENL